MSDYSTVDCVYVGKRALTPDLTLYKNMYDSISIINLFIHADSFGYALYEMSDHNGQFIGLFLQYDDFKNIWPGTGSFNFEVCSINDQPGEFTQIDNKRLDKTKKADGKKLQTYILQRALWPTNESLVAKHKKIEYETCRYIIEGLGDVVHFKQQYQILEYKADVLFELKHTSLSSIPSIILEIDEDGHTGYDSSQEKQRQAVCEYFSNKVVRVSVPRKSTDQEIKNIAYKTVSKIKNMINDLVAQYTEDISPEFFMERVNRLNIEKKYITWFYKKSDDGSKFKYNHESVAEFLGYKAGCDTMKYKTFRGILKKHLDSGEDYIEKLLGDQSPSSFSQKEGKNHGGAGLNKKVFMLTRTGFFMLCMVATGARSVECRKAFAQLYELSLDFAMSMKAKITNDIYSTESKKAMVEKRINDKVLQKTEGGLIGKLKKRIEELEKREKIREEELIETTNKLEMKTSAYNDSAKKRTRLEGELEESNEKYKNYEKSKTKYINRYKKTSTELKECKKDKEDALQRLEKYNTKSASSETIDKYKKKIQKYKNMVKVKDENISLLDTDKNKWKTKANKYVNMVNEKIKDKNDTNLQMKKLKEEMKKLKEEMKKLKESSGSEDSPESEEPEKAPEKVYEKVQDPKYTEKNMRNKTISELKDLCRSKGIGGYSKYKKKDLIDFMLNNPRMK
jgi:hypothetical protein